MMKTEKKYIYETEMCGKKCRFEESSILNEKLMKEFVADYDCGRSMLRKQWDSKCCEYLDKSMIC